MTVRISAFYRFTPIEEYLLPILKVRVLDFARAKQIFVLVLLGKEGINGTVAGPDDGIREFKKLIQNIDGLEDIQFKDSISNIKPFRRFKVDIRPEIVTIKQE